MRTKNYLILLFLFITIICLSEINFEPQFYLPKINEDDILKDIWLADYDGDNQDEIYISYFHLDDELIDYWRLVEYNQEGDTLSVFTEPVTEQKQFSRSMLMKLENSLYLLTIYDQLIDEFRTCIIEITDWEDHTPVDITQIDIGWCQGFYGYHFTTNYIYPISLNDSISLYIGLGLVYSDDEWGDLETIIKKYRFFQNQLTPLETIENCGLSSYDYNDFIIATGAYRSSGISGTYGTFFINRIYNTNPSNVEQLYSFSYDDPYSLQQFKIITENDTTYTDLGSILYYGPDHHFICYSPDYNDTLWISTETNIYFNGIRSSTVIDSDQGHFIMYFSSRIYNVPLFEVRDRSNGEIVLSQESEIQPIKILKTIGNQLFFINDENNGFQIYTLEGDILSSNEFELSSKENTNFISNYPNPFNPQTTISFNLLEEGEIQLDVFNIKGQKIKSLLSNQIAAGEHSIIWNGEDASGKIISSGVYLYKLNVNGKTEAVKKCLLLK
ncbi:MAG: T9SS type A sorting domain-containing protein [Candidatus Cloacimonetes bacterium]|nr:T9SS type A sorting domain-containing protein [Candidatus Cloacimonadota bacterium]